jgi:Tol biopolymer transport system component
MRLLVIVATAALGAALLPACAYTSRVSQSSAGVGGDAWSEAPDLSADGRWTAFESDATNLVPGDTNGVRDVFVRDNQSGAVVRVSIASFAAEQANGPSRHASISADGRYVAFESDATNLGPGDVNGVSDVYRHDRDTDADGIFDEPGATAIRVAAVSPTALIGNAASTRPALSGDGLVVAYESLATNLLAWPEQDTNGVHDIYTTTFDASTGLLDSVRIVSRNPNSGPEANGPSLQPDVDHSGAVVAFMTLATNLLQGDTNDAFDIVINFGQILLLRGTGIVQANASQFDPVLSGSTVAYESAATNLTLDPDSGAHRDVFVSDWFLDGHTTAVSRTPSGGEANGDSRSPTISGDGTRVAFTSDATDLVAADTNGQSDVFVRARSQAFFLTPWSLTQRASTTQLLDQANSWSSQPRLSNDGRYIAFTSSATNLATPDPNGGGFDVFVRAAIVPEITNVNVVEVGTGSELPPVLHVGTNQVRVHGRGFGPTVTALLGSGITVTVTATQFDRVELTAVVAPTAPTGPRDISIGNLGSGIGPNTGSLRTCTGCVQVVP